MSPSKRPAIFVGAVLGILIFILFKVFLVPGDVATHYHSNFAVFVDGEKLDLSADKYMEDVSGCKPDYVPMQPEERVHMHNNEDIVAHVHDEGATWGHFFHNIGFTLSDSALITDDGTIYANTAQKKLTFIVNGKEVDSLQNRLLGNEDQVLISYGAESLNEIIEDQFSSVADNAPWHNEHPDPGSCSGEIDAGLLQKLKKAVWR